MTIPKVLLAFTLAMPMALGQLPSIAERALKREAVKKENEARHAAALEKQKANEEARQKAREERKAAGEEQRAKDEAERTEATATRAAELEERKSSTARRTKAPVDQEQGVTSPVHGKYMKQVVFAKADRLVDAVNEAEFTNEFNLGDPIYFRVFMDKIGPRTLAPLMPDMDVKEIALGMAYGMRFTLAGKPAMDLKFTQFSSRSNNMEWTTWRGYFVKHSDADITSDQGGELFREFLARATQKGWVVPGKNKLKVEIYPWIHSKDKTVLTGDVVASGEVTMNYAAGVISAANPVLCNPYKQVQKDPALEGQIIRYAQSAWKPTEYKPAAALLTSKCVDCASASAFGNHNAADDRGRGAFQGRGLL